MPLCIWVDATCSYSWATYMYTYIHTWLAFFKLHINCLYFRLLLVHKCHLLLNILLQDELVLKEKVKCLEARRNILYSRCYLSLEIFCSLCISWFINSDSLLISTSHGKGRLMYRKLVMEWPSIMAAFCKSLNLLINNYYIPHWSSDSIPVIWLGCNYSYSQYKRWYTYVPRPSHLEVWLVNVLV